MSACPGACNRSYRHAESGYRAQLSDHRRLLAAWHRADPAARPADPPDPPARHEVSPIAGEPVWCGRCASLIGRSLVQLDDLVAIVSAQIDGTRPALNGYRAPTRTGAASPEPRLDLIEEVERFLTDWEDTFRRYRGWPPRPRTARFATTMMRTVAWLAEHLAGVLSWQARAEEFGSNVLTLHSQLRKVSTTREDVVRKPLPCPRCGTRQLVLVDADRPRDRRVECQGMIGRRPCGKKMTIDEYDQEAVAADEATPAAASHG